MTTITPDQIRHLRTEAGLTQHSLGLLCGVSQITVSRWENGKAPINPKQARHLAAALDITEEPTPAPTTNYTHLTIAFTAGFLLSITITSLAIIG